MDQDGQHGRKWGSREPKGVAAAGTFINCHRCYHSKLATCQNKNKNTSGSRSARVALGGDPNERISSPSDHGQSGVLAEDPQSFAVHVSGHRSTQHPINYYSEKKHSNPPESISDVAKSRVRGHKRSRKSRSDHEQHATQEPDGSLSRSTAKTCKAKRLQGSCQEVSAALEQKLDLHIHT